MAKITATIKNNYIATTAPLKADDSSSGYTVGSMWIDITHTQVYICTDDTVADARWHLIGGEFVKNVSGATILKGSVIYQDGASGQLPTIALAKADSEATSHGTWGIVVEDIGNNAWGYIKATGAIYKQDTSSFSDGEALYLSSSVAGGLTNSAPSTPDHSVFVGRVDYAHANNGVINVRAQDGFESYELHDVAGGAGANDFLIHDGSYYSPTDFDAEVSANTDVIANTAHTGGDGSDHVDVASNTTHRTSTGADHTYIDQDVTSGSTPTFTGTNFTGMLDTGMTVHSSAETLHAFLDDITTNGYLDETTITDAGGLIVSWVAGNEAYVNGTILDMTTTGSPYTLADNATNYMYATVAGGTTFIISTTPPTGEYAQRAIIYTEGGSIIRISEDPLLRNIGATNHKNIDDLHSEIVASGMEIAIDADATNANDFTIATGVYYIHAHERETLDAVFYSAGASHASSLIERYYHAAGVWTEEASNGVDFGFWDNGTAKTAVNNTKWYMAPVFWEGGDSDRADYVYPQTEHASEEDALDEAITYPPYHQGAVVLIGKFIFRGNATAFGSKAYFVDARPLHGSGGGSGTNQNVFQTHTADSGSTTADSTADTLTHTGGNLITTSISGDTITYVADAAVTGATKGSIVLFIDGGGSAIATGAKAYGSMPYAGTITKVRMLSDVSTSTIIDVWKDTYANGMPTVADTITASAKPTLTTALKSEDSTLTGWTTSVAVGDIIRFNVDSNDNATFIACEIFISKTGV